MAARSLRKPVGLLRVARDIRADPGMAASSDTRLWYVRHGQIDANTRGLWHGSTDSPLNELGRTQAARVARWFGDSGLPIAAVYTSPLQRTFDTAQAIASALEVELTPLPGLREYGIGDWEGSPFRELQKQRRFFEQVHADAHWSPPGGESRNEVFLRMDEALRGAAQRHAGEHFVAVGHGAAFALTLSHWLHGSAEHWWDYHVHNGSVSCIDMHPEPSTRSFDATTHLDD